MLAAPGAEAVGNPRQKINAVAVGVSSVVGAAHTHIGGAGGRSFPPGAPGSAG